MTGIMNSSWTAHSDREFVAFITGTRLDHWGMTGRWLSRTLASITITGDFVQRLKRGRLGSAAWFERTAAIIKDWWLFEAFATYFTARDFSKVSVWAGFSRKIGTDETIGSNHQSYRIMRGLFENLFVNMPAFLTGSCAILIGAWHEFATAAGWLGRPRGDRDMKLTASGQTGANDQLSSRARTLVGSHR